MILESYFPKNLIQQVLRSNLLREILAYVGNSFLKVFYKVSTCCFAESEILMNSQTTAVLFSPEKTDMPSTLCKSVNKFGLTLKFQAVSLKFSYEFSLRSLRLLMPVGTRRTGS